MCTFSLNTAYWVSGNRSAGGTFHESALIPGGGKSNLQGGAIAVFYGANVEIHVCTFEQNEADNNVSADFEPLLKSILTKDVS